MKKLLFIACIILATVSYCQESAVFYIVDGNDDVNEGTGEVHVNSNEWLKFGRTSAGQWLYIGLRYQNVTIPVGAEILSAHIQFTSYSSSDDDSVKMSIDAHHHHNSPPFGDSPGNVYSRDPTYFSKVWHTQNWQAFIPGPDQRTPDLKEIVQAVVDLEWWEAGNAMVFKLYKTSSDQDSLFACSWEYMGDMYAPVLYVEYIDYFGVAELSGVDKLILYPNPASDNFNIRFTSENTEYYFISVNDLSGKEVYVIYNGKLTKGLQEFNISTSGLGITPGLYFVNIRTSKDIATLKLLVR